MPRYQFEIKIEQLTNERRNSHTDMREEGFPDTVTSEVVEFPNPIREIKNHNRAVSKVQLRNGEDAWDLHFESYRADFSTSVFGDPKNGNYEILRMSYGPTPYPEGEGEREAELDRTRRLVDYIENDFGEEAIRFVHH